MLPKKYIHQTSKAERVLKIKLNNKNIYPVSSARISNMIIDLAFPNEKVAIEIDGKDHLKWEQFKKDSRRDYWLEKNGWLIRRFRAKKVWSDSEGIIKRITEALKSRKFTGEKDAPLNNWIKPKHI